MDVITASAVLHSMAVEWNASAVLHSMAVEWNASAVLHSMVIEWNISHQDLQMELSQPVPVPTREYLLT